MKFKNIILSLLIAITGLMWTGCKKEATVNAKVIASQWYTPTTWDGESGDWFFDVSNTAITKEIVESGAILAYVNLSGDLYNDFTVRPLPAYAIQANWDFLLPNDGDLSYGTIEFTSDMVNMPLPSGCSFRFILIPSNFSLKSASLNTSDTTNLKKMSYQEVCKLFGIQE